MTEIDQVATVADCVIFEAADDILSVLLGRAIDNLPDALMIQVWKIAGRNIHNTVNYLSIAGTIR